MLSNSMGVLPERPQRLHEPQWGHRELGMADVNGSSHVHPQNTCSACASPIAAEALGL